MAMTEEDITKLHHEKMTCSEFENRWNDDHNGLSDSTNQFVRFF